jgi:signal peptidase I
MFRFRIRQESAAGQIAEAMAPTGAAFLHPDTASGQALQAQPPSGLDREAEPRSLRRRLSFRLFVLTLFLLTLQTFVVEISVVPTGSMEGTILVGDHLFLDKLLYGPEIPFTPWRLPALKSVHRGDIIVFRYPRNPEETFLKRVAAVGGDRLEIRDGVVYINSRPVNEPYAVHRRPLYAAHEQMQPIVIPAGKLFVMGDNRDNSSDSREWGLVPGENVIGEPMLIYWSYDAPSARWLDQNFTSQVGFYASIAGNFFSRTRWDRMGRAL